MAFESVRMAKKYIAYNFRHFNDWPANLYIERLFSLHVCVNFVALYSPYSDRYPRG